MTTATATTTRTVKHQGCTIVKRVEVARTRTGKVTRTSTGHYLRTRWDIFNALGERIGTARLLRDARKSLDNWIVGRPARDIAETYEQRARRMGRTAGGAA